MRFETEETGFQLVGIIVTTATTGKSGSDYRSKYGGFFRKPENESYVPNTKGTLQKCYLTTYSHSTAASVCGCDRQTRSDSTATRSPASKKHLAEKPRPMISPTITLNSTCHESLTLVYPLHRQIKTSGSSERYGVLQIATDCATHGRTCNSIPNLNECRWHGCQMS
jgi:hypothetical protein